ncbi:MAG: glycosyltransferase [Rhodocyclaceae bacterium]|nr:glycosyltransferase [Rhodocyclaceae bacterium]
MLPKMPGATWVLMLHNGELGHGGVLRLLPVWFLKWLYRRFDKVLVISQRQASYYSRYVSPEKLVAVKSYLPASNYGHFSSIAVDRLVALKVKSQCPLITLSGYPLKEYGYQLFFDAIEPLLDQQFLICLCFYGEEADRVQQFVPAACSDRVLVLITSSEHGFSEVLRATDIYVRPNLVDSFGVAVADAVTMGKVVIASDVCERVPGAVLFKSGEVEALERCASSGACR